MLLIAALIAISGALYLSTERNESAEISGAPLLPGFSTELNSVSSLSVIKGGVKPVVTIHKKGEQWTVADRADYPADVSKLRRLLISLGDAKIREQKTSDPANYPIIGVEDPTKAGSSGAQIEVQAKDGKHDIIVGKSSAGGNYVRRAGEKQSYVVEPGISFEAEPRYWIETQLLDIPTAKIQSLDFKPSSGPGYSLHRVIDAKSAAPAPPASHFELDGAPKGRQAAEAQTLTPSPTSFGSLSVDDVAAATSVDFGKPTVVTVTLTDGNVLTFTGTAAGDKRWIEVAAPKDATLNAKANGRAFEIANYRYDAIFRPLEQLLVPKPAPAAAKTPPSGAKPAPSSHTKLKTAPKP
jgi:hypothetical protein